MSGFLPDDVTLLVGITQRYYNDPPSLHPVKFSRERDYDQGLYASVEVALWQCENVGSTLLSAVIQPVDAPEDAWRLLPRLDVQSYKDAQPYKRMAMLMVGRAHEFRLSQAASPEFCEYSRLTRACNEADEEAKRRGLEYDMSARVWYVTQKIGHPVYAGACHGFGGRGTAHRLFPMPFVARKGGV